MMERAKDVQFEPGNFMFWYERPPPHDKERWCGVVAEAEEGRAVVVPMGLAMPVRRIIESNDYVSKPSLTEVLEYAPTIIDRLQTYEFTADLTRAIRARQAECFRKELAFLKEGKHPLGLTRTVSPTSGTGIGVLIGIYGADCMCKPIETTSNPYEITRPAEGIKTSPALSEINVAKLAMIVASEGFGNIPDSGLALGPNRSTSKQDLTGYLYLETPPEALECVHPRVWMGTSSDTLR